MLSEDLPAASAVRSAVFFTMVALLILGFWGCFYGGVCRTDEGCKKDFTCKLGSCHPLPPPPNRAPTWSERFQSKVAIKKGETLRLLVRADEPDGDALRFSWKASLGTFEEIATEKELSEVRWKPPSDKCQATITVSATEKTASAKSIQHTFTVTCKSPPLVQRYPKVTIVAMTYNQTGDLYMTGFFEGTVKMGKFTVTSAGVLDYLVCKISAQGEVLWVSRAGSRAVDRASGIAVDSSGDAYVSGFGDPTYHPRFDDMLIPATTTVGVVAKISGKTGKWLWVRAAAPLIHHTLHITRAGKEDAVIIAGQYSTKTSVALDKFVLDQTTQSQAYVAKLDKDGRYLWAIGAKSPKGTGSHAVSGVYTDSAGDIYISANMDNDTQLGSIELKAPSKGDKPHSIFVAKISKDGKWLWGKVGGSSWTYTVVLGRGLYRGIAVDAKGNSYVTGAFMDNTVFGKHTLTNPSPSTKRQSDIFVAKLNALGSEWEWVKRVAGTAQDILFKDTPSFIATDAYGQVFVSGLVRSTDPNFDGWKQTFDGDGNRAAAFIAKIEPNGHFSQVKLYHSPGKTKTYITAMTVHEGMLSFAGVFTGDMLEVNGQTLKPDGAFWARTDADAF